MELPGSGRIFPDPAPTVSGSTTLVAGTEVKRSHYNITLRFYCSICNNNKLLRSLCRLLCIAY
jgi:hypothetical protein